ncbi:MAG: NAD-dependent epimerase/dehydratase family protein [Nannocystaceae bacterium]
MTESTTNAVATKGRRVLVTGATGFLGQHLCAALVDDGFEVVALCRDPESSASQLLPAQVERLQGDVLDADAVSSAALGCEGMFHCAGQVSRDPEDALDMMRVNFEGTKVALTAAKTAKVKRVVLASTSGTIAISESEDDVADETLERPLELINRWGYYRSKLYAEEWAIEQCSEDFEVVVANPSLLLGPGDLNGSSTVDVRRYLEQPLPVAPHGGIAFVDARDAARGLVLAFERGVSGRCYLLNACNCSTRTFLSRIARVSDLAAPVFRMPNSRTVSRLSVWLTQRANDLLGDDDSLPDAHSVDIAQHFWYCDASRAERELGWQARDPMVTLADTVEDLRNRGLVMMSPPS